jgi:hypothetical protein
MNQKCCVLIACFSLILLSVGLAFGQPKSEEDNTHLERNLAINLVVEPTKDTEGFTIITAKRHFLVETEVEKSEARVELKFEGEITPRGRRLIVGERRLDDSEMVLVSYRIRMRPVDKPKEGGYSFVLEGSAFLEENKQVLIGRWKDMVLKIKLSSSELK